MADIGRMSVIPQPFSACVTGKTESQRLPPQSFAARSSRRVEPQWGLVEMKIAGRGLRSWDGQPLPSDLQAELRREWERCQVVQRQVQTLEALQKQRVAEAPTGALGVVQELRKLRAVGWQSAWGLGMEFLAGACLGIGGSWPRWQG